MSTRTHILKLAGLSVLFALTAGGPATHAGEPAHPMRPIGPHEPILASIGEKRLVASFAEVFGHCAVALSVWDSIGAAPDSSVRGAVDLAPGEALTIENPKNTKEFLGLLCGDDAKSLVIKASSED